MAVIFEACCPKCGSRNVHRSSLKTAKTVLAHTVLMRAFRCHECMTLHFGPLWMRAKPAGHHSRHKAAA